MAKHTVQMVLEKTTKGAARYQEVDSTGKPLKSDADGAKITSLYLRKAGIGGEPPQAITVEYTT